MLNKRSLLQWAGILAAVAVISASGFLVQSTNAMPEPAGGGNSDLIRIEVIKQFGDLELPPASFRHDKHTAALKDKDCATCHKTVDGKMSLKFQRTEDQSADQLKTVYHENCIGCHTEMVNAGQDSGPIESECRSCHVAKPESDSAWIEIGMDKSLHFRHIDAKSIKPVAGADVNCGTCHHVYDKAAKKTVWEKDKEDSCRACHKSEPVTADGVTISTFADASHQQCVVCHMDTAKAGADSGPVNCAGCHTAEAQAKIKVVKDVPRLMRGQPDATVIAPVSNKPVTKKEVTADSTAAVAFNHKVHEQANDTCRVCHHEKIASCTECHTTEGKKEGAFVQLSQAMHAKQADASCVGCHNQQKAKVVCAGCHTFVPNTTPDSSCASCHNVPAELAPEGAEALSKEQRASVGLLVASSRQRTEGTYDLKDIPERVSIDAMVNEYEAVDFPHRKIIETMVAGIKGDKLAASFHTDPGTFCQGCHHNSPVSKTPPACATCHGKPFEISQGDRPGLKAAYHQQCMNCHTAMRIEKPANTACNECHKKRDL
ncbi:sulfate respiration complex hexadecaheme cytochrome HmcA [Oleidesulfovibrio sp.]|uniref:sulfate respiration complex hexadecaheme cytochrome HmcA n=1 Tax=Oleidesulfovibrio sp. TaxID=2909707 RepID=UPI003A8AF0D7